LLRFLFSGRVERTEMDAIFSIPSVGLENFRRLVRNLSDELRFAAFRASVQFHFPAGCSQGTRNDIRSAWRRTNRLASICHHASFSGNNRSQSFAHQQDQHKTVLGALRSAALPDIAWRTKAVLGSAIRGAYYHVRHGQMKREPPAWPFFLSPCYRFHGAFSVPLPIRLNLKFPLVTRIGRSIRASASRVMLTTESTRFPLPLATDSLQRVRTEHR